MIAYPEGLPYPLRDGNYGFNQVSPSISTELQVANRLTGFDSKTPRTS